MEKIRKYETFYSINHKRELNFILLEHDYQKYINDMYCPWCLEAELFYRNPKNRVAHLVLKNSSKHSENCRLSEKSDKITEEDLELLLSHNLFNKKKFFDKFLMDVREKYNEQVKL